MNPEAELLSGLLGGLGGGMGGMHMGGPGVSFSFTSMGPGGTTFYSSSGGGPRQRRPNRENIEGFGQSQARQRGPFEQTQFQTPNQILRDCCMGCFKNIFGVILFFQILTGYLPQLLSNIGTQYLTNDSNIYKYNFSLIPTNQHTKSFVTPLFTEEFYVDSNSFEKLTALNKKDGQMFSQFQRNMEQHMLESAQQTCGEAQTERNRLLKRAHQLNHRPEKQDQILEQAEKVKGLEACQKYSRFKDLLSFNN